MFNPTTKVKLYVAISFYGGKGRPDDLFSITEDIINMLMSWRHSGFNGFCGPRIHPCDEKAMENLARYIIRASFLQERITYIPKEAKVIYQSKDGKQEKVFDALEWLAAMCSNIPDQGEQMVLYYEY